MANCSIGLPRVVCLKYTSSANNAQEGDYLFLQLAKIEGFAQGLLEEQEVHIEPQITIQENYGQVTGVKIEDLRLQIRPATTIFNRIIGNPLRKLYYEGFERSLVILVDALDEAVQLRSDETIVDLLANADGLPKGVRFVLTSRLEGEALRHFERLRIPCLILEAGGLENQADVQAYVRYRLDNSDPLQSRLMEEAVEPDTLVERVEEASRGNFLYLVWLLRSVEEGTQRFDTLEALPEGLDGIYRDFLRTRKVGDIDRWRSTYRPLLGVLAAAQEPLTIEQLLYFVELDKQQVKDSLLDVEQFLDPVGVGQGQYRLYHQSVADFLSNEERAQEFWIDMAPIHQQIADYYLQAYRDDWIACDEAYGLQNLSMHLARAGCFQELRLLVQNPDWYSGHGLDLQEVRLTLLDTWESQRKRSGNPNRRWWRIGRNRSLAIGS